MSLKWISLLNKVKVKGPRLDPTKLLLIFLTHMQVGWSITFYELLTYTLPSIGISFTVFPILITDFSHLLLCSLQCR